MTEKKQVDLIRVLSKHFKANIIPDMAELANTIDAFYNSLPPNRNNKQLSSFIVYCEAHPQERFWQALCNWSDAGFILTADRLNLEDGSFIGTKDTFYLE